MRVGELIQIVEATLGEGGRQQHRPDDLAQGSAVPINALESSLQHSSLVYGMAPIAQVLRLLRKHIYLRQGKFLLETHRVQEAQTNLSKLLQRARSGDSQLVGGFQKGGDPVLVISVAQLAEVIGDAMNAQSLVDLLPASRLPLCEELPVAEGAPASPSAVQL